MFAGSFADILGSRIFRESFERDFAPSLTLLPVESEFVALGPTPLAALEWCAEKGLLDRRRILGAFAHPSTGAGSQVDVYLGARDFADLHANDPVKRRAAWLLDASRRMAMATGSANTGNQKPSAPIAKPASQPKEQQIMISPPATNPAAAKAPYGIHAIVTRGQHAGEILRPHVHEDGKIVVSPTRFEKDYVRLSAHEPLEPWLSRGYRLRMSLPHFPARAASLIAPASIRGRDHEA